MTLFTVQLELGPETRAMLERAGRNAVIQLELGPKTLRAAEALATAASVPKKGKAVGALEGLLGKGAEDNPA